MVDECRGCPTRQYLALPRQRLVPIVLYKFARYSNRKSDRSRGTDKHPTICGGSRAVCHGASIAVLGLMLVTLGCTRGFYRHQADREVYSLVDCGSTDPRWPLEDYTIQPSAESRFYDPDCPDRPPMPPDDPTSHELMHCVDGKHTWPYEKHYGCTPYVENPAWQAYLSYDDAGYVTLDSQSAVLLALVQSRDYQRELEDLYLSALDVTFQRFRFDAQFFGGNSTFFTADGPIRGGGRSRSTLDVDTDLQMRKLFAPGGELIVGVANSLVWQFAGPDDYSGNTLLDFSLVQPLLRAGGRAVVMENLTDTERALLANIRQMERFRRGFYIQIVAGRNPGPGPARGGVGFGGISGGAPGSAGGFLGLLEEQVRIRNREENVAALQNNLDRMEAFYKTGRAKRFQVGQIRQQLYDTQSTLLRSLAGYDTRLDAYKVTLGLPPDLNVAINDPMLQQFELIDPVMRQTQDKMKAPLLEFKAADENLPEEQVTTPAEVRARLALIRHDCLTRMIEALGNRESLQRDLPVRYESLRRLFPEGERVLAEEDLTTRLRATLGEPGLKQRVAQIDVDLQATGMFLGVTLLLWEQLQATVAQAPEAPEDVPSEQLVKLATLEELIEETAGLPLAFPLDSDPSWNRNVFRESMLEAMKDSMIESMLELIRELMIDRLEGPAPVPLAQSADQRVKVLKDSVNALNGKAAKEEPAPSPERRKRDRKLELLTQLMNELETLESAHEELRMARERSELLDPVEDAELRQSLLDKLISLPLDPKTDQNLQELASLLFRLMSGLSLSLSKLPLSTDVELDPEGLLGQLYDELSNNPWLVQLAADVQPSLDELTIRLVETLIESYSTVPLLQARIRLEQIMLVPVDLASEEALQIARANRRDWMNARAALVDAWRQIELAANDLESDLDVTFSGDLGTTQQHPFRFRATNGRLRVGLQFDAPLTRLAERNAYRETLINYQRARRQYYAIEDQINQNLRETLRQLELNQLDFEVRRGAVDTAVSQVDESQLRLQTPPKPGQSSSFGDTLAQDLVRDLNNLLETQNALLGVWVDQELQRMSLDMDLGTMQLDAQGLWIDPGPIRGSDINLPEEVPLGPEIWPVPEFLPPPGVPEYLPRPAEET